LQQIEHLLSRYFNDIDRVFSAEEAVGQKAGLAVLCQPNSTLSHLGTETG
jgi:hypothetical protein